MNPALFVPIIELAMKYGMAMILDTKTTTVTLTRGSETVAFTFAFLKEVPVQVVESIIREKVKP